MILLSFNFRFDLPFSLLFIRLPKEHTQGRQYIYDGTRKIAKRGKLRKGILIDLQFDVFFIV